MPNKGIESIITNSQSLVGINSGDVIDRTVYDDLASDEVRSEYKEVADGEFVLRSLGHVKLVKSKDTDRDRFLYW